MGITITGGLTIGAMSVSSPPPPPTVDYLVVAGGGGGGYYGGGGGAGGVLYATATTLTNGTTYTITVGTGGAPSQTLGSANNGANSSISGSGFSTVTAIGGGGGGGNGGSSNLGGNGGSGGGAAGGNAQGRGVYPGSTYLSQARQGYDGGNYNSDFGGNEYMGSGGGAGAAGSASSNTGTGGIGLQNSITGTATYYGGGGGGGGYTGKLQGGLGGGGRGGTYRTGPPYVGSDGTVNTGGGAGGGGYTGALYAAGGTGGSGVVIIRTLATAASTTGSPTVTTDGSYNVYKFTGTGSITF